MNLSRLFVCVMLFGAVAGCTRRSSPPAAQQPPQAAAPAPQPAIPKPREAKDIVADVPSTSPKQEDAAEDAQDTAEAVSAAQELSTERLIVFLPEGPLLVELRMTIDGQPFRSAREELVDEVLKLADRDGDGRPTWDEIYSDPKRTFVERFDVQTRNVMRKEFLKTYDTNQNGLIDRDEARRIVSRAKSTGDAFSLDGSTQYRHSNRRQSIVRAMLDANGDEALDAAELAAADERLLARDANGDHLVSWDELDDSLAGDEQAMSARQSAYLNQPAALRLGPRAAWDGIVYALAELYLSGDEVSDDASPLLKSLADHLDADRDRHVSYEEVRLLDTVEPQLVLAANFGRAGDLLAGVSVVRVSDHLGPEGQLLSHLPNGLLLRFADYRLRVLLDDRQPAAEQTAAEAQFAAFDKDKNGYLEKDELGDAATEVAQVFDQADADANGKLYFDEWAAYRRRQQPQTTAIHAVARDDQDVLFPLLDGNEDGRLSTRELQAARQVLSALDADEDGRITLDELPGSMTLWFARGVPMGMSPPSIMMAANPAPPTGPDWFVQMDENRDQEVSLDEFPGTVDKFQSLDLDGDGFLSLSEASSTGQ